MAIQYVDVDVGWGWWSCRYVPLVAMLSIGGDGPDGDDHCYNSVQMAAAVVDRLASLLPRRIAARCVCRALLLHRH